MSFLDRVLRKLNLERVKPSTSLVPVRVPNGRWEQVRIAGSEIVRSYLYTCKCQQSQELTLAEAKDAGERKCGCGLRYNLLRDLALTSDSAISDYETALATLPVQALAVQQPRRPAVLPLEYASEPLVYTGGTKAENEARQRGFDAGDPGYTNLF